VEGFPFVHFETARFNDLDGMGHVNNAVFSEYIEQARLAWFGQYAADEPMPLRDVILPDGDRLPLASRLWRDRRDRRAAVAGRQEELRVRV
jgi:hypothetical protein